MIEANAMVMPIALYAVANLSLIALLERRSHVFPNVGSSMITRVRQWLAPPHFDEDEEKTRQAWLLSMLSLYFSFGLVFVLVIFVPFFAKEKVVVGAMDIALLALNGFCRKLIFRGQIVFARTLIVITIWFLFQGVAIVSGGISSPTLFTIAATTIIIGLLFKWWTGTLLVLSSILAGLGMAVLQENGVGLPTLFFVTPMTSWFLFAMALVFMHSTMNLNVRNLEHALALAHQQNAARQQAEQSLRESETHFRDMAEQLTDVLFTTDEHGAITYVSPAANQLFARKPDDMIGRPFVELLTEPEIANARVGFERVIQFGESRHSWNLRMQRQDGVTFSGEMSGSPISKNGQIVGVLGLIRDVSAREQMEEALRKSEERYALAAQGSNDGLWDWDLSKDEIYYSPRWKSMLGIAEGQIGNSPDEWFGRVHPEDAIRVKEEISYHLRGTAPFLQSEHRVRQENGSYLWVLARALAIRDGTGVACRMVGSISNIAARKHAEEQLIHDAFHDALTGLPNRSLFVERLDRAIERTRRRSEYKFAVLYLDLDRFKSINDSLGHSMGDRLLVAVTQRLRGCVRSLDTVARFGGDEFVILLDDIEEAHDAASTAERIQTQMMKPIELDGHRMFISASVGVVLNNAEYAGAEEILRDADIAMYQAKSAGRARHAVFDTKMRNQAFAHAEVESDLRGAVEREEFRVHYQPIVSLENGGLEGLEALVRWQHPRRGLLAPIEFIGVAEETGLIVPIGKWVLREACRQMRDWQTRFADGQSMTVHVNLSAKQVCHPSLTRDIKQALDDAKLAPGNLSLEITESVLMENSRVAVEVLKELQAWGVRVELDDFGTGYSSLNYLHQFPISVLKVDRTFINKMEESGSNPGIVQAIIKLGHDLGMKVVAEGLETQSQLGQLKELECDYGQGYYFAKPQEAKAIEGLMEELTEQRSMNAGRLV